MARRKFRWPSRSTVQLTAAWRDGPASRWPRALLAGLRDGLSALELIRDSADGRTKRWFALALAFMASASCFGALAPLALKQLVDQLLTLQHSARLSLTVVGWLAMYVGSLIAVRACDLLRTFADGRREEYFSVSFGHRIFSHLIRAPLTFHLERKSGALLQAKWDGIRSAQLILHHAVQSVLPPLIQLAVAAGVLAWTFGWSATLGFAGASALYVVISLRGLVSQRDASERQVAAGMKVGALAADALLNVETIKSFTAEQRVARRYRDEYIIHGREWRGVLYARLHTSFALAVIFALTLTVSLVASTLAIASGRMSLGEFVLLNSYALQLLAPLETLCAGVGEISRALPHIDTVGGILAGDAEEPCASKSSQATFTQAPSLTFENVSFAIGNGRSLLDDISFRCTPGSTIAIVGPTGSGKSTILRLILRLYNPTSGEIYLDGAPTSRLGLDELRRQISFVSQETILLNDTIAANIRLAAPDATDSDILRAATAAALDPLLAAAPLGLHTQVGERGLKLSGGEKQRISLARAVLKGARLIVLDEATSALDPKTEEQIVNSLRTMAHDATIVIVTHRLATITHADTILVMQDGRIAERGKHAELMRSGGLYRRLWSAAYEAEGQATGIEMDTAR